MTKVLNISDGQFLKFVTSFEYDRLNRENNGYTVIWENSFPYSKNIALVDRLKLHFKHPNEYEIIYD